MSADEKTAGSSRDLKEKPITASATPPGAVLDPKPAGPKPLEPIHRGRGPGFLLPHLFRTATYTFTVQSMEILDTRSAHNDSDKASVSMALGDVHAQTVTKDLGDVDNGTHPISLEIGPVRISDPDIGIVFNYLIANAGHADSKTIDGVLTKAGNGLAEKGAKAATAAVGAAVGASFGSFVLPVIGTALGALAGVLANELIDIITADCDGVVAAEQPAFKGIDLWNRTQVAGEAFSHTTFHPGTHSNTGCGGNSRYFVTWTVTRVSTEEPVHEPVTER